MNKLISDMKSCEQTKGLSVLAHGLMVHRYFMDLYNHVMQESPLKHQWRLPEWSLDKRLWGQVLPLKTIKHYQIFHDCGKPYCLEIDNEEKRHFPNHAEVSGQVWESYGRPP